MNFYTYLFNLHLVTLEEDGLYIVSYSLYFLVVTLYMCYTVVLALPYAMMCQDTFCLGEGHLDN